MTSNVGSPHLTGNAGESGEIDEGVRKMVLDELRSAFRPEFLNRVDDIVLFKPLTLAEIKRIVEIQLRLLRARLVDRHIEIELTERACEHVARQGYDPVYGARPLKRFLQRQVETALSRKILAGEIGDHSRVQVDFRKGELVFEDTPFKAARAA
jgi:ATP-dependent Clp protease ATP-binding subunit ClpB